MTLKPLLSGLLTVLMISTASIALAAPTQKHDAKADAKAAKTEASDTGKVMEMPKAEAPTEAVLAPGAEVKFPDESPSGGSDVATEAVDPNPNPKKEEGGPLHSSIKWILFIVLILFVGVLLQLNNVIGLLGELSGKAAVNWGKWNPRIMVIFMLSFLFATIWEMGHDSQWFLPESAAEHGKDIDYMFDMTTWFILIVFFITQFALFYFPYKYRHNPAKRAYFYAHNDKLEIIWTVIPAIALAVMITGGLKVWNAITAPPPPGTQNIEVYAFQFGWKARYSGVDKELGKHNFRLINGENDLGVDWTDGKSHDDIITQEIHLPVNVLVNFKYRAKDVIHSAYMPYFRSQINVVPGVPTNFWLKPTITTSEMREILQKKGRKNAAVWDYYMFCNKICGSAHYNMKIKMVVETQAEYDKWLNAQKATYVSMNEPETPAAPAETTPAPADSTKKDKKIALLN